MEAERVAVHPFPDMPEQVTEWSCPAPCLYTAHRWAAWCPYCGKDRDAGKSRLILHGRRARLGREWVTILRRSAVQDSEAEACKTMRLVIRYEGGFLGATLATRLSWPHSGILR
jgi:hypothetical protein